MEQNDYIPRQSGKFDAWQNNFVAYAEAHAKDLGLSDEDIDELIEYRNNWEKRYGQLTAARDAFGEAAQHKAAAQSDLTALIRTFAARIQQAAGTTDAMRAALGITIRDPVPTRVRLPGSEPLVSVDTSERLRHTLHFVDSATPTRKAKPYGVMGAEVWVFVGDATASQVEDVEITPAGASSIRRSLQPFKFAKIATRTPTVVEFDGDYAGRTASYLLRWLNTRGQPGPASAVASATIVG